MTTFARIEQLLKHRLGLDVASIGMATFERAVLQRAAACGAMDHEAYWLRLQHSVEEMQELAELVVVPETWFFRNPAAFEALVPFARQWTDGLLRVLSLPCASGEEPYSIAMTLLDAGLPADRFLIDALDVSQRALQTAQRGEYGRNAFRSRNLGFRDRYFHHIGDGRYRVNEALHGTVRWQHANLFADNLLHGRNPYDVVFCRNLLIYFDRPGQERTLTILAGLLAEDGCLFVGPSEAALLLEVGFEWLKQPGVFAFRRPMSTRHPSLPPVTPSGTLRPATPARQREPARASQPRPVPLTPPVSVAQASGAGSKDALREAVRLADQGRLAEAEQLCNEILREQPATAQVLYLVGLLHDARGDLKTAVDWYRRALYLDPGHEQTLLHLACLREKQGDYSAAKRLLERARRLHEPPQRRQR